MQANILENPRRWFRYSTGRPRALIRVHVQKNAKQKSKHIRPVAIRILRIGLVDFRGRWTGRPRRPSRRDRDGRGVFPSSLDGSATGWAPRAARRFPYQRAKDRPHFAQSRSSDGIESPPPPVTAIVTTLPSRGAKQHSHVTISSLILVHSHGCAPTRGSHSLGHHHHPTGPGKPLDRDRAPTCSRSRDHSSIGCILDPDKGNEGLEATRLRKSLETEPTGRERFPVIASWLIGRSRDRCTARNGRPSPGSWRPCVGGCRRRACGGGRDWAPGPERRRVPPCPRRGWPWRSG